MLMRFVAAGLMVENIVFADFLLIKVRQACSRFVSHFSNDFRMSDALLNLFLLETWLGDLVEFET